MHVYHVEYLDIDNPLVHKGRCVLTTNSNTFNGYIHSPSKPGFSGGQVLNIRGRGIRTFAGCQGSDGFPRKVFVKNNGLAAFLDGLTQAGYGSFFDVFEIKKWLGPKCEDGRNSRNKQKSSDTRSYVGE